MRTICRPGRSTVSNVVVPAPRRHAAAGPAGRGGTSTASASVPAPAHRGHQDERPVFEPHETVAALQLGNRGATPGEDRVAHQPHVQEAFLGQPDDPRLGHGAFHDAGHGAREVLPGRLGEEPDRLPAQVEAAAGNLAHPHRRKSQLVGPVGQGAEGEELVLEDQHPAALVSHLAQRGDHRQGLPVHVDQGRPHPPPTDGHGQDRHGHEQPRCAQQPDRAGEGRRRGQQPRQHVVARIGRVVDEQQEVGQPRPRQRSRPPGAAQGAPPCPPAQRRQGCEGEPHGNCAQPPHPAQPLQRSRHVGQAHEVLAGVGTSGLPVHPPSAGFADQGQHDQQNQRRGRQPTRDEAPPLTAHPPRRQGHGHHEERRERRAHQGRGSHGQAPGTKPARPCSQRPRAISANAADGVSENARPA